ncbi:MAG: cytochrome bd ubiquinol oxidase subunit [Actinomycetota bacterium]|nr:cytochrome bd ubiquinol oxidase subunit [Actinomycetota bacterium]
MTTVVGAILFLGVVLYAIFGGADFGAGFWDLTAGGAERGRRPRGLIDLSIGPVWEANHMWLIFCLVVAWTAFPAAFAAVMRTLYVPLGLAALGIVLRGSGFAFRKVSVRTQAQRANGAVFAISSVVTPFFLGTVAGAIAAGRVPLTGARNGFSVWVTPTSLFTGALAVATCAYLAAVFLTAEARKRGLPDLEAWYRNRALLAAAAAGFISVSGLVVVHANAPHLFHRLLGPGLPFVSLSVLTGLGVLGLLRLADHRILRALAAAAVFFVIAGWGAAQYPYLLGNHLRLAEAAAPTSTLVAVTGVFVATAVICIPSLGLLYFLQQKGALREA